MEDIKLRPFGGCSEDKMRECERRVGVQGRDRWTLLPPQVPMTQVRQFWVEVSQV